MPHLRARVISVLLGGICVAGCGLSGGESSFPSLPSELEQPVESIDLRNVTVSEWSTHSAGPEWRLLVGHNEARTTVCLYLQTDGYISVGMPARDISSYGDPTERPLCVPEPTLWSSHLSPYVDMAMSRLRSGEDRFAVAGVVDPTVSNLVFTLDRTRYEAVIADGVFTVVVPARTKVAVEVSDRNGLKVKCSGAEGITSLIPICANRPARWDSG